MSQIVSPILITLGVLTGVVCTGWVLAVWLHDRYPAPSGKQDQEDKE